MRDVTELEVFVEVARQGGFSAAARRLGLAPSLVADRISGLEKRLGVRLLARTTRRCSLTAAGEVYFEAGQRIASEVQALERRVAEEAGSARGALRVTAPTPLGRRHIAPFVGRFAERHPEISVHLSLDDRFLDIVGQGFDIAIRGGPSIDTSLTGHRLFETRRVVVASPGYVERHGAPARPEDLAGHRCIVHNTDPHFHAEWRFGRGEAARGVRVTGVLAATNSDLPVAWAVAGLGLAQKSWWEVAEHVEAGRLVVLLAAFEPEPAAFFAIHPVSRGQSRKVELFVGELITALGGLNG